MSKLVIQINSLHKPCFSAWFFVLLCAGFLNAQVDLGERLEKDGRLDESIAAFERVIRTDSTNERALAGIKRIYKTLGRNSDRIPLLIRQLNIQPQNITLLAELADAQFRTNRDDDAQVTISRILSLKDDWERLYGIAASVLIENGRFERALDLYKDGRRRSGIPTAFSAELIRVLTYLGDFEQATREVLLQMREGQISADQARVQIMRFPDSHKENVQISEALRSYLVSNPNSYILQRLRYEILFRDQQYEEAFQSIKTIDTQFKKEGAELLVFANDAFEQGIYEYAMKAYRHFLSIYPVAPQAEMGVARCLEKSDILTPAGESPLLGSEKIPEAQRRDPAIAAYQEIIRKYPKSVWSAEASYRTGNVLLYRLSDVDAALTSYFRVREEFPQSAYRLEAAFCIADCYVRKNDLANASATYAALQKEIGRGPEAERAVFKTAELFFLMQNLDSASALFRMLAKRSHGTYTNDAFSFLLLLQENHKTKDLLAEYGRALLYARQQKPNEALTVLTQLIKEHPKAAIVDDALMLLGDVQLSLANPDGAVEVWRSIADYFPDSPLGDLALKRIADVYASNSASLKEAVKVYRELLLRYPRTIYGSPVRKKLRELEQRLIPSS